MVNNNTTKRTVSVFIASPGDLTEERKIFRSTIDNLNSGFGIGADVEFVPLGWEDTLASTGRRSQSVINDDIDRCDIFILLMYRRWGQPAPDALPYSSYTEEEFHRALEGWKNSGSPEIFVFFKRVDAESEGDPGKQLSYVIKFRKELENSKKVIYKYFSSKEELSSQISDHLMAYAKGYKNVATKREIIVLPINALEEIEKAKLITLQKTKEAQEAKDAQKEALFKFESQQLQIAEDAAKLSKEGKIEFAREKFTKLFVDTDNIRILSLANEFFFRTGDLESATKILEKWLNLSGDNNKTKETAMALVNLGILYKTRGDLDRAEEMFQKSLAIEEDLGHKEGMASNYGNLGVLYNTRGDLDRAEEMYQKAASVKVVTLPPGGRH